MTLETNGPRVPFPRRGSTKMGMRSRRLAEGRLRAVRGGLSDPVASAPS